MLAGKIIGNVWSTVKNPKLKGLKLLLVRPYFSYMLSPETDILVAVDLVDAGEGDDVILSFGVPGRHLLSDYNLPVEAAITHIIDSFEISEEELKENRFDFAFSPETQKIRLLK